MLVATKPSVSTSHVATSLFPSLLFRPAHASRVVWPDWFARAFRVAYTVAIVGYTALSLTGNTSAASSSLFSLIGRGNLWLFGPDPARDYLHVTACWRSITSNSPFCDGAPAFASYRGSLDTRSCHRASPLGSFTSSSSSSIIGQAAPAIQRYEDPELAEDAMRLSILTLEGRLEIRRPRKPKLLRGRIPSTTNPSNYAAMGDDLHG
jgi:hypothetical protein